MNGLVQPETLEERLAHITEAKRQYQTEIPWLADTMENDLKHALGDRNNSEFVVSPEGKILIARSWSDPVQLRKDLGELVGKSETVTAAAEQTVKSGLQKETEKKIARGVVPRVDRPSGGVILKAEAESLTEGEPLFVKLRVEASRELLQGRAGELHLGFHLDPIHRVHWNNLAAPLRFELSPLEGVKFEKNEGTAAKITEVEADADPREFLIKVDPGGDRPGEPLVVRIDYFACDDQDRWCKAVSQQFTISWEVDRDAGRVQGQKSNGGSNRPGNGKGRRPNPDQMIERLDKDGDGKISRVEARGPLEARFKMIDQNEDELISKEELDTALQRMRR